ncbi:MAG: serine hydrolase [Alphaproteobacteria bacterium]|nr:serine hydrolase [Alphaproteobacteria bacterium]
MIARRPLLVLGSVILSVSLNSADAGPPHDWQQISPAEAGFLPDVGEKLDDAVRTNEFANLHAVVVARGGKLVLERYYEGADERRGDALGIVKFGPEVKHDLRSVTKSIVDLLYGIALADGRVADLDQSLVDQFPAYEDLAADPKRRRMTVLHALSMTLGTEWDEDLPYSNPRNSETAMDLATDRYRYVLERPFVAEPGSQWNYNGGATALLAHLISRGTGRPLLDFARERLFEPLGIADVEWLAGSDGEPIAASGLRMRPRDLAKIGQLVLDRGTWGESRLVPSEWLDQSFTPRVHAADDLDYGYHWWLGKMKANDQPWIGAFGNGGQRLFIIPSLQLVVVIAAGNYNKPDQWKLPVAVMSKVVLPALRDK